MAGEASVGEAERAYATAEFGDVGRPEVGRDDHTVDAIAVRTRSGCGVAGDPTGSPAPQAADVRGSRRERRVRERVELGRRGFDGLSDRPGGRSARDQHKAPHSLVQQRIHGHQGAGFDDLGLVGATLVPHALGERFEVGLGSSKGRNRLLSGTGTVLDIALGALHGAFLIPEAHNAYGDPRSGGDAGQDPLRHQLESESVRSSARMISAVEVAPGSWCPIERSPR